MSAYLKKDRQEIHKWCQHCYGTKQLRFYFVNAWRIVDEKGLDIVLPWMNSKREAVQIANDMKITLS